jgi:hypothetical protein
MILSYTNCAATGNGAEIWATAFGWLIIWRSTLRGCISGRKILLPYFSDIGPDTNLYAKCSERGGCNGIPQGEVLIFRAIDALTRKILINNGERIS